MKVYRKIIDGNKLIGVFDLPKELRESEVEVIITPIKEKGKKKFDLKDLPVRDMGKCLTPLDRNGIYGDDGR